MFYLEFETYYYLLLAKTLFFCDMHHNVKNQEIEINMKQNVKGSRSSKLHTYYLIINHMVLITFNLYIL